ncbi:hypothetical protein [Pantoea ananatis]|uniref:hypothetical protein n=1 Tax=Pantoea ananas TaxID=553 RepID=UPI000CF3F74D|nr:hypothetical protein [Pantoea ananatis]PQK90340.1 hypothetical protein CG432_08625 [Pantoea ananatis]PWV88974.1 hypothetical protein C7426_104330 [Pantoea ananatis]
MEITFDQLKELTEIATSKDWIDYVTSIGSLISSVAIILLTCYIFFKTPNQTARSKVYEKEVDLLYKAFDCFCLFSDAVGLYASNKHRKYKTLSNLDNKPLEESFSDKEKQSSENVYPAFKEQNMASSLLHSIGDLESKKCVDSYKKKTVELREIIINFETSIEKPSTEKCKEISDEIGKIRDELETIKNCFLNKIRDFKDEIKKQI